jgi:predicted nuclease of predicted toxin-antitoxin system
VKFLVDMPLSPTLARWLANAGHDVIHTSDIGMARASDIEIVGRAQREQRTVITADLDYSRLLALTGAMEPSLILFRGGDWSDADVIARIGQLLASIADADLAEHFRHRTKSRAAKAPADPRLGSVPDHGARAKRVGGTSRRTAFAVLRWPIT